MHKDAELVDLILKTLFFRITLTYINVLLGNCYRTCSFLCLAHDLCENIQLGPQPQKACAPLVYRNLAHFISLVLKFTSITEETEWAEYR